MQPRRARYTDTARLNSLEVKMANMEGKLEVKSTNKILVPISYFMNSCVDGLFGKFVFSLGGIIRNGLVVSELNPGPIVPKVRINFQRGIESSGIEFSLTQGLNEISFTTHVKVKVGDVISIESPTPDRIKSLALSFNIEN